MPIVHVQGTATKIELPTGEQTLVVEIAVECAICGEHRLRFAGHHLRAIRDLVIAFVDEYPVLAGPEVIDRVVERLQGITGDPKLN